MIYTVRHGDSLTSLAMRYGVSVKSILAANPGMSTRGKVNIGQQMVMPTARRFKKLTAAQKKNIADLSEANSVTPIALSDDKSCRDEFSKIDYLAAAGNLDDEDNSLY